MDNPTNTSESTLIQARRLLGTPQHDKTWQDAAETLILEMSTHIASAEVEVDAHTDPIIRGQATNRIGELISTRQKLVRIMDGIQPQSTSLWAALKQKLGIEEKENTNPTPLSPTGTLTAQTTNLDGI